MADSGCEWSYLLYKALTRKSDKQQQLAASSTYTGGGVVKLGRCSLRTLQNLSMNFSTAIDVVDHTLLQMPCFLDFLTPCPRAFPLSILLFFLRPLAVVGLLFLFLFFECDCSWGFCPWDPSHFSHALWVIFSTFWPLRHWISPWNSDPHSVHMYYFLWIDILLTFQTQHIQNQVLLPYPLLDNLLWVFTVSGKAPIIYSWAPAILGLAFNFFFLLTLHILYSIVKHQIQL